MLETDSLAHCTGPENQLYWCYPGEWRYLLKTLHMWLWRLRILIWKMLEMMIRVLLIRIGPQNYQVRHVFYSYVGPEREIEAMSFFGQGHSTIFFVKIWPNLTRTLESSGRQLSHGIPWIPPTWFSIWEKCVCVCIVLVQFGPFPQKTNGKSAKFAVSANSSIFMFDFKLFVVDIHQIMLISLFPTPFDDFTFTHLQDTYHDISRDCVLFSV